MKLLCFGDSNTYGYDPRSYFGGQYPPEHRWVDLLAQQAGCKIINAGENGREIPVRQAELQRFQLMLSNQNPIDRLIILLGDNDLLQGNSVDCVVKRMEYFLSQIQLDKSKILLIGPPPMQLGQWVPTQVLVDASVALNREYQRLSVRLGVGFADAGSGISP